MTATRLDRLFWWNDGAPPSPERIAAQVMVMGDLDDIREIRSRFGAEIFEKVLASPPPGLFDPKSWCFWHRKPEHATAPPLPAQPAPWPRR